MTTPDDQDFTNLGEQSVFVPFRHRRWPMYQIPYEETLLYSRRDMEHRIEQLKADNANLRETLSQNYHYYKDLRVLHQSKVRQWKGDQMSQQKAITIILADLKAQSGVLRTYQDELHLLKERTGIFAKILQKLWRELRCPVCFNAMREPRTSQRGHTVCLSCIMRSPSCTCGICRAHVKKFFVPFLLRDAIQTIGDLFLSHSGDATQHVDLDQDKELANRLQAMELDDHA